ncbi:metal ABC transporter solute-binding protein, Zn/Mn family [Algibacter lectus]|uniref:Manganese/zinc/iron transport system substrate-binding protein n=2 Tax=Algibacter lectus TaxID=221126 RepID=A0A4R8MDE5_9FLAO|nr:zinc ABC transporter substrate-binding protein [Algibacter lectus]MWW24298.1 zinc ABC transporter solute-binding protein [Algibacter lectus]TDY62317.1 manganese/zinc/iron transport system substrate-binding protein [Algibacter lectus]SFC69431.1 manganese/zinc/iron transport system substrate-binding protein [Algibacter lectus]
MKKYIYILFVSLIVFSCKTDKKANQKLNIVTTTSMITDLVKNVAGDEVNVQGLMGSGVDPHLYKASEGDVSKLSGADIIFYNGLHLEGKLVEIFEKMRNIKTVALSDAIDEKTLIGSEYFASNYDPHIWFNTEYWIQITQFVADKLSEALPEKKDLFQANSAKYIVELKALQTTLKSTIETLPKDKRILVTAHDAFNYFGKAYGFQVRGLQGISTATEAGVQDVQNLSAFIIENKIKAIFIESSVPKRTIEALQAAVNSKDHNVDIGGSLYSDALGTPGTPEGTYIGMFKYNVNTIVNALK